MKSNIFGLTLLSILFMFSCIYAEESITITSYYPSPYGVYNELQLYAHNPAVTTCDDAHKGTMFYKSTDDQVYVCKGATLGWQTLGGSKVVQIVSYETGILASGSATIPWDNTIPQQDEGNDYMSLAITPTSATNKLRIDVIWNGAHGGGSVGTVALFKIIGGVPTADALAAVGKDWYGTSPPYADQLKLTHIMDAGTTSPITFQVRAGTSAGPAMYFNGNTSGGQLFGGVNASSIVITEYVP